MFDRKIAFVKLKDDDIVHRIPATDATETEEMLLLYDGKKPVGKFVRENIEQWAIELVSEE